ncbi:MAG: ferrochelatase [Alphaproteobacteria bacterium]
MKRAVVLLNLGGPDSLEAVEPFLISLFSDPAILRVPGFVRGLLARAIARRRAPEARAIYAKMGGASPILAETTAQAGALAEVLGDSEVLVAMRHWHPRAREVAEDITARGIEDVILLPLYPQFSTTTTGSSLADFERALKGVGYGGRVRRICCYPDLGGFIGTMAEGVRAALGEARRFGRPKVLLSAHGLPERIVQAGDPYQWQVEQTAAALVAAIGDPDLDWTVCYQSRVGPLKWIGPETRTEIEAASAAGRPIVVVPVAFVSEHSETLVELDIEYRALAAAAPAYFRVPTVRAKAEFAAGLASLVSGEVGCETDRAFCKARLCPPGFRACPHNPNHRTGRGSAAE